MIRFHNLLIIYIFISECKTGDELMVNVFITPNTVGTDAEYQFTVYPTSSFNGTYSIEIQFPQQVSVESGSRICYVTAWDGTSVELLSCNANSKNLLVASFKSSKELQTISLYIKDGLTNPPSILCDLVTINILDINNNIIQFTNNKNFNYDPLVLNVINFIPSSYVAGERTSLEINFINDLIIPQNGFIKITLPLFCSITDNSFYQKSFSDNVTIIILEGIDKLTGNLTILDDQNLIIQQGFPNDLSPNNLIKWSFPEILNPATLRPTGGYIISVLDSKMNLIQISNSMNLTMKDGSPINIDIHLSDYIINHATTLTINFNQNYFLLNDSIIQINFPSEIQLSANQISQIVGISNLANLINYNINGQNLTLLNAVDKNYSSIFNHQFSITSIMNPKTTKPTGFFELSIFTSDNYLIYTTIPSTIKNYIPTPGAINSVMISANNTEINQNTSYTFNFNNNDMITSNGYLKIIFPMELIILDQPPANCFNIISGLSSLSECQVSNQTLTIVNCCTSTIPSNTNISFSVNNVTNYNVVKKTSTIIIQSYSDDSYLIDEARNIFVNFTEGYLLEITINQSSLNTWDLSNYIITFNNKNPLPSNSSIIVTFPSEIGLEDPVTIAKTCMYSISLSNNLSGKCNLVGTNTIILQGFNNNILASNTTISLTFLNLRNPRTVQVTGNFFILTITGLQENVDKSYNPLTVLCKVISKMTSVSIVPLSLINGRYTSYSINIIPKNKLVSNDILKVGVPIQVGLSQNTNITVINNLSFSPTFTINNINTNYQIISIILKFPLGFLLDQMFSFSIDNVKNPASTKQTDSFTFNITDSNEFYIEKYYNPIILTTTIPDMLLKTVINVVSINTDLISDLQITMMPINQIPINGKIIIDYPSQINVLDGSCESCIGISSQLTCYNNLSFRQIQVTNGFPDIFFPSLIQFKLAGLQILRNANNSVITDTFGLTTQTYDGFIIDSKTNYLSISFNCKYPCQSCEADLISCLSCDLNSTTPFLYLSQCVSQCPLGFYDSGGLCNPCDNVCESCDRMNSSNCITCSSTFPFLLINIDNTKTCVGSCDDGYFIGGQTCHKCKEPCKTCTDLNNCLSCINSDYVYDYSNFKCFSNCTSNYLLKGGNCMNCNANCNGCLETLDNCIECKSNYLSISTKEKCVKYCPQGFQPVNSTCNRCDINCNVCSDIYNQCEICNLGYENNENNKCVKSMPKCNETEYLNLDDKLCYKCDINCLACENNIKCNKCEINYLLQNGKCVSNCQIGYYFKSEYINYSIFDSCEKCDNLCKTCIYSSSLCTSCYNPKIFYENSCWDSCKKGYFHEIEGNYCDKCSDNCEICEGIFKCTKCSEGFYKFNGYLCFNNCPNNTVALNNSSECINIPLTKSVIIKRLPKNYFCFFFLSLIILIITYQIKTKITISHYFGLNIVLFCLVYHAILIYLMTFLNFSSNKIILSWCLYLIIFIYLSNIFFVFTQIRKNALLDPQYVFWSQDNNKVFFTFLQVLCLLINYKIFRISYTRIIDIKVFRNFDIINRPFRTYLLFDLTFINFPNVIITFYLCFNTPLMSDLFYVSLELCVVSSIIIIIVGVELYTNKYPNNEFYRQTTQGIRVCPFGYIDRLKVKNSSVFNVNISMKRPHSISFKCNENRHILDLLEEERYHKLGRYVMYVRRRKSLVEDIKVREKIKELLNNDVSDYSNISVLKDENNQVSKGFVDYIESEKKDEIKRTIDYDVNDENNEGFKGLFDISENEIHKSDKNENTLTINITSSNRSNDVIKLIGNDVNKTKFTSRIFNKYKQ